MNEKLKNTLLWARNVYFVWVAINFLGACVLHYSIVPFEIMDALFFIFLSPFVWLIWFLFAFLFFLPAIIFLFFIFKKVTNKNLRIWLVAFFIPFLNLIYLIIERLFFGGEMFSMFLGAFVIFFIMPITFLLSLSAPKELLSKVDFIKTHLLMWAIGFFLICISFFIVSFIEKNTLPSDLKSFQPVIEYLIDYKKQNGVYPDNFDEIDVNLSKFPYYEYETFDNNSEFKFHVAKGRNNLGYNYCSDKKYFGCKEEDRDYDIRYVQRKNKWIEEQFVD